MIYRISGRPGAPGVLRDSDGASELHGLHGPVHVGRTDRRSCPQLRQPQHKYKPVLTTPICLRLLAWPTPVPTKHWRMLQL